MKVVVHFNRRIDARQELDRDARTVMAVDDQRDVLLRLKLAGDFKIKALIANDAERLP